MADSLLVLEGQLIEALKKQHAAEVTELKGLIQEQKDEKKQQKEEFEKQRKDLESQLNRTTRELERTDKVMKKLEEENQELKQKIKDLESRGGKKEEFLVVDKDANAAEKPKKKRSCCIV